MSTTHDIPRSNRNRILTAFRKQTRPGYGLMAEATNADRVALASYWAGRVASADPRLDLCWHMDATVSQQVFAARVLYRYVAVFGGVA
jgi:hypothetical protein